MQEEVRQSVADLVDRVSAMEEEEQEAKIKVLNGRF